MYVALSIWHLGPLLSCQAFDSDGRSSQALVGLKMVVNSIVSSLLKSPVRQQSISEGLNNIILAVVAIIYITRPCTEQYLPSPCQPVAGADVYAFDRWWRREATNSRT